MVERIKEFHRRTLDRYNESHKEKMEDWKQEVLKLHERSGFLFYYENCELEEADGSILTIQGELAKDLRSDAEKEPGKRALPDQNRNNKEERSRSADSSRMLLYLYNGQGELLGEGILMSDPYEKEEKRRGFLRLRKNECNIKIETLYGKAFAALSDKGKKALLARFFAAVSLISDAAPDRK